jgi:hypothetical protein
MICIFCNSSNVAEFSKLTDLNIKGKVLSCLQLHMRCKHCNKDFQSKEQLAKNSLAAKKVCENNV